MTELVIHVLQLAALFIFSAGFFELPYGNSKLYRDSCSEAIPHTYDRLVFVLIDALREDFVYKDSSRFSFVNQMLNEDPRHAIGLIAKARAPTVTMPRLKALTAGTPPIFLDLILNFDEGSIAEGKEQVGICGYSGFTQDTWIRRLKEKSRKIVFYGDDTWIRLFPNCFDEFHGISSFFVQDYTDVDNQVTERAFPKLEEDNWDAMILHYLGIDHIGHIDGAHSKLMGPKQQEMDEIIRKIYRTLQQKDIEDGRKSLIIALGDHGMADNGNHGGSSDPEINTAAIFLSPTLEFEVSNLNRLVVNQIDIVPTLSGLFGLSIPKANTGIFIKELIPKNIMDQLSTQNLCQLKELLGFRTESRDVESSYQAILESLSLKTANYNIKLMLIGIALTVICVLFYAFELLRNKFVTFILLIVYCALQGSSSFIEEEHEFWHFIFTSLIGFQFILYQRRNFKHGIILLFLSRITRYWNAVGYQRAQDIDARYWLPSNSYTSILFLFLSVFTIFKIEEQRSLLFSISSIACCVFKIAQSDALIKTSKSVEIFLARVCYVCIGVCFIVHFFSKRRTSSLRNIFALLFLFLLKIHNAIIVVVLVLISMILDRHYFGEIGWDELIRLAFIHYSYFALGPSNLLVSLDFSNAYIGLTQFNMLFISTITFLITWSGPLLASLSLLKLRERSIIKTLSLWRNLVTLGLLVTLTVNRNHLFIWTVFAPRLVFEFGWAVFYLFLIVVLYFINK